MTGDEQSQPGKTRPKKRRGPKKATAEYLERSALFYLERYPASTQRLRRNLLRKVKRSADVHGTDGDQGARDVEALIEKLTRNGFLDDAAYARGRAITLHRRGAARRAIALDLRQRGLGDADIESALLALEEEAEDPDLAAALAYAKRRRIGCFREREREEHREKDLAALARRGFSYGLAQRVVDAQDPQELLEEAGL